MEMNKHRNYILRLIVLWLGILLLGSFWLTQKSALETISMTVLPQVPREGGPVITTFWLNNPSSEVTAIRYQFYANGELLKAGATTITPGSSQTYRYVYENPLKIGEQLNFMVKTQSKLGNQEKIVSLPSYPPQIWSSFVSFASFSTSVISSMSSMSYYGNSFTATKEFNIGLVLALTLIILFSFLEITQPGLQGIPSGLLGQFRIRLSTVNWILLIIFMGMVYTKLVLVMHY